MYASPGTMSFSSWVILRLCVALVLAATAVVMVGIPLPEFVGISNHAKERTKQLKSATSALPRHEQQGNHSFYSAFLLGNHSHAGSDLTFFVPPQLRPQLRERSDLSCKLSANRNKLPVPSLVVIKQTFSLHPNWCHFVNDGLAPLYALRLSIIFLAKDTPKTVVITKDRRVLICGEVSSNNAQNNRRQIIAAALDCDGHIKAHASGKLESLCSEDAFELESFDDWRMKWSVHVNGNYNWHRARFVANPAKAGRSQLAIMALYRQLASHLQASLLPKNGSKLDEPNRAFVMFANRRGKRRVSNMDDMEAFAAEKLGRRHVRSGVFYFEGVGLEATARALSHIRVFVSPHGANMANILLLPRGASVIELIPFRCQRLRIMYQSMAMSLGLRYYAWQPSVAELIHSDRHSENRSKKWDEDAFSARDNDKEQCSPGGFEFMDFRVNTAEVLDMIHVALADAAQELRYGDSSGVGSEKNG